MPASKTTKLLKRTDKLMGRKSPKKPNITTSLVMDAADIQTLRTVAHWRVASGSADTASVSDLVRAAVAEYIERHGLAAEEYAANQAGRMGAH